MAALEPQQHWAAAVKVASMHVQNVFNLRHQLSLNNHVVLGFLVRKFCNLAGEDPVHAPLIVRIAQML